MPALWELLVDHARDRASQLSAERFEPEPVTKELSALAGDEVEPVHRAWEDCMQRYADSGELAWLHAATYLVPLVMDLQRQQVQHQHDRLEDRQRVASHRRGRRRRT